MDHQVFQHVNFVSNKSWFVNGNLHRDNDLPAIEYVNGSNHWFVNGKRHRENDLPAIENVNGSKQWFVNGERHRESGLPAVANGLVKEWWLNGKVHRDNDLPAISKWWYVNGKLHRDNDLPAIEYANGTKQWWVMGIDITKFREKYKEVHKLRAQKKIYYWIIQRLYRPGSESAKRLALLSWKETELLLLKNDLDI